MISAAVAFALLVAVAAAAVSQGAVVQEFGFQIKDVRTDGGYTLVFNSSSFDQAGGVPDPLTQDLIRLPRGAAVRPAFVDRRYYCDLKKLVDLVRSTHPNAPHFNALIDRTLLGRKVPPRNTKDVVAMCRFAHIGGGTVLVDARPYVPLPFPAHFEMFWAKPSRAAVGTFAIVGSADDTDPVVAQNPAIRDTHPLLAVDLFDDPTPDGLYGYRISLPVGPIAGINISFAEVHATTTGLTLTKNVSKCVERRGGKCVRKKSRKASVFWFTRPSCPASGRLSFQAFYAYAKSPSQTKTIELPCPRFGRGL